MECTCQGCKGQGVSSRRVTGLLCLLFLLQTNWVLGWVPISIQVIIQLVHCWMVGSRARLMRNFGSQAFNFLARHGIDQWTHMFLLAVSFASMVYFLGWFENAIHKNYG